MNFRRAGHWLLELVVPISAFASTHERRRYWGNLPVKRSLKLFAALFFVLSSAAFFADLLSSGKYSIRGVLIFAVALGILHVATVLAELRRPILMLVPMALIVVAYFTFVRLSNQNPIYLSPSARQRVVFDSVGLFTAMMVGYRLFLSFSITEGLEHVQLQTELEFAHAIQTTLVPTVVYENARLQAYGRTVPSAAVGGDIVDLVVEDGVVLAYVADVSGHGIPAGVLMGMVKTVVHHGVLLGQPLPALLDGINKVLPEVKEPSMYATLSAMRFDGSSQPEYTSAGHLPMLHFRRSSQDVTHCSIEQFPLGLFPAATYASDHVQCGPGDLLAIVTDGMSETCDANGEDFGLERLAQLLREHAARPLSEIFQIMLTAVTQYGKQDDDRTLLLVRILG